jgi:hypothetical protein
VNVIFCFGLSAACAAGLIDLLLALLLGLGATVITGIWKFWR